MALKKQSTPKRWHARTQRGVGNRTQQRRRRSRSGTGPGSTPIRSRPPGRGEATLIAGGRAGRVRIIRTSIQPAVREMAWELVAGPPGLALRAASVGTPHTPSRYRPGRSQAGSYLALTSRLKVLRPLRSGLRPTLTRPALARAGTTGRPGWAVQRSRPAIGPRGEHGGSRRRGGRLP